MPEFKPLDLNGLTLHDRFEERLAFAAPYIQASLERSPCGSTLQEVLEAIVRGEARLWTNDEGVAVTERQVVERVWHAGGSLDGVIDIMNRALPILQKDGIERLAIEGTRPGWERALAPHGFEPVTALVKDVG